MSSEDYLVIHSYKRSPLLYSVVTYIFHVFSRFPRAIPV